MPAHTLTIICSIHASSLRQVEFALSTRRSTGIALVGSQGWHRLSCGRRFRIQSRQRFCVRYGIIESLIEL